MQYRVMVTRRPRYACRACEQVVVQNSRISDSHREAERKIFIFARWGRLVIAELSLENAK